MNLLSFLWRPKTKDECSLYAIEYKDDKINIILKENISYNNENVVKSFLMMNRTTKEELIFSAENDMKEASDVLMVTINMNDYKTQMLDGIWDAYLLLENGLNKKKLRIINDITDNLQTPPYYVTDLNKSFLPYSTVKENLSFKIQNSTAELITEKIILTDNGSLMISGYFIVPTWNINQASNVKKSLVIKASNEYEMEFEVKNILRDDITKKYGQSGINFDWTGIEVKLDFLDDSFEFPDELSLDFYIRMEYGEETIMFPINVSPNLTFNNKATINAESGVMTINLKTNNEDNLTLLTSRENMQVEIDEVFAEDKQIIFNGRIISAFKHEALLPSKDVFLLIHKRNSDEILTFDCKIKENHFSYTLDLDDPVKRGVLSDGIWDLYLKLGRRKFRLVTRLDGITNKQKVVNIPQQLLSDMNKRLIVIKPYYTLHNEISILIRDYVTVKMIEKVEVNDQKLIIEGKLNIQQPNEEFPESSSGYMLIKGKYGRRYNLPVLWNLSKTNKTKLEFAFIAEAEIKDAGQTKYLLEDINFNLVSCSLNLNERQAIFTMNVDPVKVLNTFEDRLKQKSKYKNQINLIGPILYRFYNRVLPIKKNVIIFQSFHGKSYSCNPKAIYETLLVEKYQMKSVWVLNNLNQRLPGNPIVVKPFSLKYYYYMAIGKYFVNNGNFPDFYDKRQGTVHLQTWHGTPLKKLGFDIDVNSPSYAENTSPELLKRNARWDYLIGPNEYTSKILKRAFRFDKQMLDVGYPRNDLFYHDDIQTKTENIKTRLNIPSNKKVILYAPTWRDYDFHKGKGAEPYNFKFDLHTFKERFGDEYVLLLRLHYRDATRMKVEGFDNFVYNVSAYDDIQELYLISDLLITDYSSVMFDFANLNRPMIFFAYDLNRYGSQIRGFYFNFKKEAPGPIVMDEDRLFNEIENIDKVQERYSAKYADFREKFCHLDDGNAARRTINTVFRNLSK